MSRTIKMNQRSPIYSDLKMFKHYVNKKQNRKVREKFQKLLAKDRLKPGELRTIRRATDLDISME